MNDLITMYQQLAPALTSDPLLCLASAVATFDPLWRAADDLDDEGDPLDSAMHIIRTAFPDIYAEAVWQLRCGATYSQLDSLICAGITARGIPVDNLEAVGWGIPLDVLGVDLEDPEFYEAHTDLRSIMNLFGVEWPEMDAYQIDIPDHLYTVGRSLASSLCEQTDPALVQVGWALGWLFSCTGNSLLDYSYELMAEIEPLQWSPDDIAFAVELIQEAETIWQDVQAGLDLLKSTPELCETLERNIAIQNRSLGRKGKADECALEWKWTAIGGSDERTTVAGAVVL